LEKLVFDGENFDVEISESVCGNVRILFVEIREEFFEIRRGRWEFWHGFG